VDVAANRDRHAFDYEVAYVLRPEDALVPAMEATGVPVHCLGAGGNADLRWVPALRRLLVDPGFDIVHFHLPYAAAVGRLAVASLPRARRPLVVYTEHSLWDRTARPVKLLNRATIGRDQALLVVSEAARSALPAPLRARARVVIHGVDLSASAQVLEDRAAIRRQVREELGVPGDDVLVVTVANLRAEKGYDVLLGAARRVADAGAPVRFAAVGRGPLREELEAAHRSLGLGDRFRFLGQRADVLRVLAGADVFVLASRHEGLPVALMEATSLGLPVVATAVGEVPSVVRDGQEGVIVAPGRDDALAEAVLRLASDGALRERLGRASLERSAMFDIAGATKEIEGIYGELLGGRR